MIIDSLTVNDYFWIRLSGLRPIEQFRVSLRTYQPLHVEAREWVGWQCRLSTADPIYQLTGLDIPVVLTTDLNAAIATQGLRSVVYAILGVIEVGTDY